MRKRSRLWAVAVVLAMVIAACGGNSTETTTGGGGTETTGGGGGGANTGEVSVFGAPTGAEGDAIQQVIEEQINSQADYTATYEGSDSFESQIQIQIEGGSPPDVAIWPQPGAVVEQAKNGNLVALEDLGYNIDDLTSIFGDYLVSLGEYNGKHYGIPTNVNFKSAIWYNVPAWDSAGYTPPETWADMIALSDKMVQDGNTPWCVGFGSEAATGWPGTDWMENIVLRQSGPDVYDQWVTNEVKFTDQPIMDAGKTFGDLLFGDNDQFVLGGAAQVPSIDFRDAPDPMFNDPPSCYMTGLWTFITNFFPEGVTALEDYNFFPFPTIDGNGGALIGGELAGVLNNRPEVLDFVKRFVSKDVQCAQGSIEGIARISPNIEVGSDCYRDQLIGQAADTITAALSDGTARFDASDLMDPAVGQGTFWQAMIDYATGGPDSLQAAMEKAQSGFSG